MMKRTTDHDEIRQFAERHKGTLQLIDHPEAKADTLGIRINFPGPEDDAFESDANSPRDISWDEFFKVFDDENLEFEYDDDQFPDYPDMSYRFMNKENPEDM